MSPSVNDLTIERIAAAFVEAFNRRDPKDWVAVFHPEVEFRPTVLVGSRSVYRGRDGVAAYLEQLRLGGGQHRARVRELRRLSDDKFVLLTGVFVGEEVVAPGAALIRLEDDMIIEATAYLSDEETLAALELIPRRGWQ